MTNTDAPHNPDNRPAAGGPVERQVAALDPERSPAAALLIALVSDTPRCMKLLEALDKAAKDENSYEYGLPLWAEPQAARLREVIYKWACGAL